jgi:hypothetical protein
MLSEQDKKVLTKAFNQIHKELEVIRTLTDSLDDEVATEITKELEFNLLAPIRRLRAHLDIPFD